MRYEQRDSAPNAEMTEKTRVALNCAVLGDGTVLTITINPADTIERLRAMIFFSQAYDRLRPFPPSAMRLYRAQEAIGTWLRRSDYTLTLLHELGNIGYEELRASKCVEDYFAAEDLRGVDDIHIHVRIPPNVITPVTTYREEVMKANDEAEAKNTPNCVCLRAGGVRNSFEEILSFGAGVDGAFLKFVTCDHNRTDRCRRLENRS